MRELVPLNPSSNQLAFDAFSNMPTPLLQTISVPEPHLPLGTLNLVPLCGRPIRFRNLRTVRRVYEMGGSPLPGGLGASDPPHTERTLGSCQKKLYNRAVKGKWTRLVSKKRATPPRREEAARQSSRRARSMPWTLLTHVLGRYNVFPYLVVFKSNRFWLVRVQPFCSAIRWRV